MKKEYKKPYLLVESFQLDAAIAGACKQAGLTPINHYLNTCTAAEEAPELGYFGAACEAAGGDNVNLWEGGDSNDGFCYHGPTIDLTDIFLIS